MDNGHMTHVMSKHRFGQAFLSIVSVPKGVQGEKGESRSWQILGITSSWAQAAVEDEY